MFRLVAKRKESPPTGIWDILPLTNEARQRRQASQARRGMRAASGFLRIDVLSMGNSVAREFPASEEGPADPSHLSNRGGLRFSSCGPAAGRRVGGASEFCFSRYGHVQFVSVGFLSIWGHAYRKPIADTPGVRSVSKTYPKRIS